MQTQKKCNFKNLWKCENTWENCRNEHWCYMYLYIVFCFPYLSFFLYFFPVSVQVGFMVHRYSIGYLALYTNVNEESKSHIKLLLVWIWQVLWLHSWYKCQLLLRMWTIGPISDRGVTLPRRHRRHWVQHAGIALILFESRGTTQGNNSSVLSVSHN